MDNKDIIEFFDMLAPTWDSDMVKSDQIIGRILGNAKLKAGQSVLDVACGTGVMFDYYLERGAGSITGIDIAPKMAQIAKDKYKDCKKVSVVCGDVMNTEFEHKFDLIVVYNAFPHFPHPEKLIARLATLLKPGGRLTVAHGESREKIDARHSGAAHKVSLGLMPADELAKLFSPYFTVETVISDDTMYQISGKLLPHCPLTTVH
ncbi:MAG: class I SAM-dependent methyltransferase [Clostridia bacterium]|nr:class I SAM-dependent methyltransferase [Clostridia bacterium]